MLKRIQSPLTAAVVCLASAAVCAWLIRPGTVAAKGQPTRVTFNNQGYWVWFSQDPLNVFEPEGPPPDGIAATDTAGGDTTVVAGVISDPDTREMSVNGHGTCLVSWAAGPKIQPWLLLNDDDFNSPDTDEEFAMCFADPSRGVMSITVNTDGTIVTLTKRVPGYSKSGVSLDYLLTINVVGIDSAGGVWDPLAMAPGESATLYLGEWELITQNPKQKDKGCYATGDLSDDYDPVTGAVGTAIAVSRWTLDEQAAQDACE